MNRLGLLEVKDLNPNQQTAYTTMKEYTTTKFGNKFSYMDSASRFLGPFGVQIHHPEIAKAFIPFAKALTSIPGFPAEVRECAILGVASRTQSAYEEYAHAIVSGFTETELSELRSGRCPEHFTDKQKIAFKVSIDLGQPGPLDSATWKDACDILGVDGATALIQYVAFYNYVSTILNGFDVQVPKKDS